MRMTAEQKMARHLWKARFYVNSALGCRQSEQSEYVRRVGSSEPVYDTLLKMSGTLSDLIEQFGGRAFEQAHVCTRFVTKLPAGMPSEREAADGGKAEGASQRRRFMADVVSDAVSDADPTL
jgi:hypothetical protein